MALTCDDLKSIAGILQPINDRLDNIQNELTELKSDVTELKSDVTELKSDVAVLKSDVAELKSDVAELKSDVTVLKSDVAELKSDMMVLKRKVINIELTLENETNKNIMVVAEGHIDLYRKLDECIKMSNSVDSKMEIHKIYINKHESEIDKIIKQIAERYAV